MPISVYILVQAFGKYYSEAFILYELGLFSSTNFTAMVNLAVVEFHH